MNNQIYLTIPFESFQHNMNERIAKAEEINNQLINNEPEFLEWDKQAQSWIGQTLEALRTSFNRPENKFVDSFYSAHNSSYSIPGVVKTMQTRINEKKETIKAKAFDLYGTLKIISVSDLISKSNEFNLESRKSLKVKEICNLILSKLYDINDGNYHPIKDILEGNGIFKGIDFDRNIAKKLEDEGYIELYPAMGEIHAKIALDGEMYIEELNMPYKENYDEIRQTPDELQDRINEVIEKLKEVGLGHEIIFDEIQELKALYAKLDKKSWAQVLKGKLIDLALGKIVEPDTMKYIYNTLTTHDLKLPF